MQKIQNSKQLMEYVKEQRARRNREAAKMKRLEKRIQKKKTQAQAPKKRIKRSAEVNYYWSFPVILKLPRNIIRIEQLEEIAESLNKYPEHISLDLTRDIASRIREADLFEHFKNMLSEIREKFDLEEKTMALNKDGDKWANLPVTKMNGRKDEDNIGPALYESYDYGLSDW